MKKWFIFFVVISFSFSVHALDGALKKKYSLLLLTDDYGILKENDLARYQKKMNDGVKIEENSWTYVKMKTKKGSSSYFVEH